METKSLNGGGKGGLKEKWEKGKKNGPKEEARFLSPPTKYLGPNAEQSANGSPPPKSVSRTDVADAVPESHRQTDIKI